MTYAPRRKPRWKRILMFPVNFVWFFRHLYPWSNLWQTTKAAWLCSVLTTR